jgi:hypothetical protein
MDEKPFLALVTSIQKTAEPQQLDLFYDPAIIAARIIKDVVDSIHAAGGNLSDLKIQVAVHGATERAVAVLSQFPHHAEMRPDAANSGKTGKQETNK